MEFKSTEKALSDALIRTTRAINHLASEDISFQRSSNSSLSSDIDTQSGDLLCLGRRLSRRLPISSSTFSFREAIGAVDSIDPSWCRAIDLLDTLLEKADSALDEFNGLRRTVTTNESTQPKQLVSRMIRPPSAVRIQNLEKPQLSFPDQPSNHDTRPFKPLLSRKPHATVSLDLSLQLLPNDVGIPQYEHPYREEIERFTYPPELSQNREPVMYKPFEKTEATIVEDYDGVLTMLNQIKQAKEIAIDLEHHDAHSYAGIVSLMQISTREKDWIIDTLKPWRRKLEILNEVLADPSIIKVLHGAHSDIIWLQRDFGLYIVGMFDTYDASRALGYAGHSLAFLLKRFIDFDAQKQYQMADWRIRPLPQELLDYARSDTHFLLYIYDRMQNELVDKAGEDKLLQVLEKSKETSLQRFERSLYDEQGKGQYGFLKLLQRNSSHQLHDPQQIKVFQAVHHWRDSLARDEDENPFQIMPNHALFNVAREIPCEVPALLALCHPISDFLRKNATQLLQLINKAKIDSQLVNQATDIRHSLPGAQTSSDPGFHTGIRADVSDFWGITNDAMRRDQTNKVTTPSRESHVALCVPHYTVTTFDIDTNMRPSYGDGSITAKFQNPSNIDISNATHLSLKVAAQEPNHSHHTGDKRSLDTITPDDGFGASNDKMEDVKQNLERKSKHGASKKQKKFDSGASPGSSDTKNKTLPHTEYTKARSVLNAKYKQGNDLPTSVTNSFDPYAMASDAASGLKRTQFRGRERSKIFKNID